jgi:hypothetical protein
MAMKIEMEDGTIIKGINEITEGAKIFTPAHIVYVVSLVGQILLQDTKGQLLNIIEGIGLSEKQETAIKRMVTNVLHDARHDIMISLELVEIK